MLGWSLVFLVLAIVAKVLGFGGITTAALQGASRAKVRRHFARTACRAI
jgi:uncharacterized membrane protein YtjA (UPF0391 family)